MSRAMVVQKKKNGALRQVFKPASYFANATGDFLLFRPVNYTAIMKQYINDPSIDLKSPSVREELKGKLLTAAAFDLVIPIAILGALATLGLAGVTVSAFAAGACGAYVGVRMVSFMDRDFDKSTDKALARIDNKRKKKNQNKIAWLRKP